MRLLPAFLALLFLPTVPCMAGTATGTLHVSMRVVNSCALDTQALTFPDYDPRSGRGVQGAGAVTLQCTRNAPVSVYLDGEQTLTSANGDTVSYAVTTADGKAWSSTQPMATVGQGSTPIRLPVLGKVAAGQPAPNGAYTGALQVRVEF